MQNEDLLPRGIWGFHGGEDDDVVLLGCDVM
jgi:hypothetical protein